MTNVGIHIRRGDFLGKLRVNKGFAVAPASYFKTAMDFMKDKYSPVQFIVASDGISWAKDNLGNDSMIYSSEFSADEDLALLASCDHVIISAGTFSWWAGWLANGTTIYYELHPKPNSRLYFNFHKDDYYPPYWIPMK